MSLSAGFAMVGCASENTINASLRGLHANFEPAYEFSLPNAVTVGSTSVSISGSAIMLAPQVTLQTRADDLISVNVAVAGELTLVAGSVSLQTEIVLSTTVLVGLITKVATVGNNQQITVGIDFSSALVTAVNVAALLGPPLSPVFEQALTSPAVLGGLTTALRAVPPGLLQITDANLGLPLVNNQTYQPPGGSIFFPDTLFDLTFAVIRIVARPLDAATPGPGALALAVDASVVGGGASVASNGDPNGLVDLNTAASQAGATVDYGGGGNIESSSPSVSAAAAQNSGLAIVVDGDWLAAIVNSVLSPQLAGKFFDSGLAKNNVALTASPDCVQLSLGGDFTLPLDSPWAGVFATNVPMAGITAQIKVTRFIEVDRDSRGYYQGVPNVPGNADITLNVNLITLLQSYEDVPEQPQPPSGAAVESVMFSTTPPGGYFYLDGAPIPTGLGPWASAAVGLVSGSVYTITADPRTFQSWSTTGNVFFEDPSGNWTVQSSTASETGLKVKGPGTLSLQEFFIRPVSDHGLLEHAGRWDGHSDSLVAFARRAWPCGHRIGLAAVSPVWPGGRGPGYSRRIFRRCVWLVICFHADFECECHSPGPGCRARSAAQIYMAPPCLSLNCQGPRRRTF